jgi:hypothetical protein
MLCLRFYRLLPLAPDVLHSELLPFPPPTPHSPLVSTSSTNDINLGSWWLLSSLPLHVLFVRQFSSNTHHLEFSFTAGGFGVLVLEPPWSNALASSTTLSKYMRLVGNFEQQLFLLQPVFSRRHDSRPAVVVFFSFS